jgi:energy-converting hydrogenase Eha subunit C
MNKIFAIIFLSLSQSGCLVAYAVEGVTDVAIAVATAPIKVGAAVVGAATGDDQEDAEEN